MTAPGNGGVTAQAPQSLAPVVVALDLYGGDGGPEVVADAALIVLSEQPGVDLLLVGPPDAPQRLLDPRGLSERTRFVAASSHVAMDEDALAAVRARPDCSVRVAAGQVRDGHAQATVSIGHTGAALVAASFGLGRIPGVTRAAVAVVVPAMEHDVVLLDAGGTTDTSADLLAQFAICGSAFAQSLGLGPDPRVGLLTIGSEPGKGDALRRSAASLLAELPIRFVGGVEGHDVVQGGPADVIVTDGFTGNVVLKALEGATHVAAQRIGERYDDPRPAHEVAEHSALGSHAGAVLLGIDGVSVVGHGASDAREIAAYVALAARAVREQLVPRTAARIAELVQAREQIQASS